MSRKTHFKGNREALLTINIKSMFHTENKLKRNGSNL